MTKLMDGKKFCRKCMIPDFVEDKDAFLSNYLKNLPDEERTEESVYQNRLKACAGCSEYLNGMCRHCGCFVALRAAVRRQSCPGIPKRWEE